MICFCLKTDYRYRKDEIFRRLKVTTFSQLVSLFVCFFSHFCGLYILLSLTCPIHYAATEED